MRETRVFQVDPQHPDPAPIRYAATVLQAGGLVAFPTETVYGLGANALDARAVAGIFAAKERPFYDPLIVHLADVTGLAQVTQSLPPLALELAAHFWPGPLTLVLPKAPQVPTEITADSATMTVRVPAHPVALALIAAAQTPIAAPSANRFGRISPTHAQHVFTDLAGRIDVILDGGPTRVGVESTVLSLLTSPPTILRPGGISREALAQFLGVAPLLAASASVSTALPSPGTTLQHYAPRARVFLYCGPRPVMLAAMHAEAVRLTAPGVRVGLLTAIEDVPALADLSAVIQPVGSEDALDEVARHLFAGLHALDQAGVAVILARDFGTAGLGLAIRDRLTRAAAGRVIDLEMQKDPEE
ncbi:MAG TPA: L-threonylcarbamoyladenylate synthase [Anaerolineae bacterium]|nr:L-threonylcarbamoyladenylate synthase [Anaerolineae bacterium]